MSNFFGGILFGFIIGIGFLLTLITFCETNTKLYVNGYKQGQIDSLNGKIVYQLKKNTDNTTSWVKIGEK